MGCGMWECVVDGGVEVLGRKKSELGAESFRWCDWGSKSLFHLDFNFPLTSSSTFPGTVAFNVNSFPSPFGDGLQNRCG